MKSRYLRNSLVVLMAAAVMNLAGCSFLEITINPKTSDTESKTESKTESMVRSEAASSNSSEFQAVESKPEAPSVEPSPEPQMEPNRKIEFEPVLDPNLQENVKYSVCNTKNYLGLRTEPVYDASNEIAQLKDGDEVLIVSQYVFGEKGEYCIVNVISGDSKGKQGFVNKNYLQPGASSGWPDYEKNDNGSSNPENSAEKSSAEKSSAVEDSAVEDSAEEDSAAENSPEYEVYVVTGVSDYLGIRSAPVDDESSVFVKLYNGDQVYVYSTEVYGENGEYWMVTVPAGAGPTGYADKNYLTKQ